MGSLKKPDPEKSYRKNRNNVVRDFYLPCLTEAKEYDRAVGFFSSSALIQIAIGLDRMILNGGKVRLIVSPVLNEKDIEAINSGYELREIVNNALSRIKIKASTDLELRRLSYLADLIAKGNLDIKVAVVINKNKVGLYHEKIGIIKDEQGNAVSFTGSTNESETAFQLNFESIAVFKSWGDESDRSRVKEHMEDFEEMWENLTDGLTVYDFPEAVKDEILRNRTPTIIPEPIDIPEEMPIGPRIPNDRKPLDFQREAIREWFSNKNNGILAMATGTGKTITGLSAAVRLFKERGRIFVLILCPYQFLVEQWKDDVDDFGFISIGCYSQSTDRDWYQRLRNQIHQFNNGDISHACFVMTIATFQKEDVQNALKKCHGDYLIIADEAHHFGSPNIRSTLPENFPFRLALSATIVRKGDIEGTKSIFEYFGRIVYEYNLEDAIKNGILVPYKYYPIPVYLSNDRIAECRRLTKSILKISDSGDRTNLESLELARARLLSDEPNKLIALRNLLENKEIKGTKYNLFYCGSSRTQQMAEAGEDSKGEIRQLEAVAKIVSGEPYNFRISKFTGKEDREQRTRIRESFAKGDIDAIVAIRCLDEGFNIPKIERAFILASSTNPKEYIQRRGRVLRKAEGKKIAYIYDFVTLPLELHSDHNLTDDEISIDKELIKRELVRVKEFARLSENLAEGYKFITETQTTYRIGFDLTNASEK